MPIDLYTKRRIDYSVNGMNGLSGRPNALNGERDDVLNANWNTDFTPEWLQGVFDSPQAQEYRQKLESGEDGVEFVEIEGPVYKKKES